MADPVDRFALFRTLSTAGNDKNLARKAWLGEICCRLMLAVKQSDYTAAIGLWHDFGKSAPNNDHDWELALLGDALPPREVVTTMFDAIEAAVDDDAIRLW